MSKKLNVAGHWKAGTDQGLVNNTKCIKLILTYLTLCQEKKEKHGHLKRSISNDNSCPVFDLIPSHGVVQPNCRSNVQVKFTPRTEVCIGSIYLSHCYDNVIYI